MQCLHPINIPNPKFGKRAGEYKRLIVPCGKCAACLSNKANQWAFRLEQEMKDAYNAYFITLTYSDDNIFINSNGYPSVNKRDVQLFFKRLRKKSTSKIKYYCVAEYGSTTYRPHYHCILFNLDVPDVYIAILSSWQKGEIHVGTVTPASIRYCTKYALKGSEKLDQQDPVFRLQSQGLGKRYISKLSKWHKDDVTRTYAIRPDGVKINLPRYYKDKIYNQSERDYQNKFIQTKIQLEYEQEKAKFFYFNPHKNLKDFEKYKYQINAEEQERRFKNKHKNKL